MVKIEMGVPQREVLNAEEVEERLERADQMEVHNTEGGQKLARADPETAGAS